MPHIDETEYWKRKEQIQTRTTILKSIPQNITRGFENVDRQREIAITAKIWRRSKLKIAAGVFRVKSRALGKKKTDALCIQCQTTMTQPLTKYGDGAWAPKKLKKQLSKSFPKWGDHSFEDQCFWHCYTQGHQWNIYSGSYKLQGRWKPQ